MSLRTEIEAEYGSVHRFCREHPELNRGTVYQVLRGTYQGDVRGMQDRIRATVDRLTPAQAAAYQAIRKVQCSRCATTTPACDRCRTMHLAMAREVVSALSSLKPNT
jgi:hypothetical protein